MDTKELLTVKEVAEILGVSVQAIYNRLETDLKPYLKIVNGKKRLNKTVLQYITPKQNSSDFKEDVKIFKEVLNILEKQNEQLSKELEIKNEQIKELNARLAEAHKMANNAQQLHCVDKALELQAPVKETKTNFKNIKTINPKSLGWIAPQIHPRLFGLLTMAKVIIAI